MLEKYTKFFPPQTREGRENFKIANVISNSTNKELKDLEFDLVDLLHSGEQRDSLVFDYLCYFHNEEFKQWLLKNTFPKNYGYATLQKLVYSYWLDRNENLIPYIIENLRVIDEVFTLSHLFYNLAVLESKALNLEIKKYTTSKDVLLEHNSKTALEYADVLKHEPLQFGA